MITGVHHIALKCESDQQYEKAKDFYLNVLGLSLKREWAGGMMIDTGAGLMEIFKTGGDDRGQGVIRHLALASDNVDEIVEKAKSGRIQCVYRPGGYCDRIRSAFPGTDGVLLRTDRGRNRILPGAVNNCEKEKD